MSNMRIQAIADDLEDIIRRQALDGAAMITFSARCGADVISIGRPGPFSAAMEQLNKRLVADIDSGAYDAELSLVALPRKGSPPRPPGSTQPTASEVTEDDMLRVLADIFLVCAGAVSAQGEQSFACALAQYLKTVGEYFPRVNGELAYRAALEGNSRVAVVRTLANRKVDA
jgi:hypothetical protein